MEYTNLMKPILLVWEKTRAIIANQSFLIEILQAVACIVFHAKCSEIRTGLYVHMETRNITNPWPITIVHSSGKKLVDNIDFKPLLVNNSYNHS